MDVLNIVMFNADSCKIDCKASDVLSNCLWMRSAACHLLVGSSTQARLIRLSLIVRFEVHQ